MHSDNVGDLPFALVLMGVTGSGKSTIGKELARRHGYEFVDADDHHSEESIRKMRTGASLSDRDRLPWLNALAMILHHETRKKKLVLACSALKAGYRAILRGGPAPIVVIHLQVPRAELERRLSSRKNHFAGAALLDSQFESLDTLDERSLNATGTPQEICHLIEESLKSSPLI